MATHDARIISRLIDRDWREVYAFAADPANLARWAAGLGGRFEEADGEWRGEAPDGTAIRVRFVPPNELGVLDHTVFVGDGEGTLNAVRVVPNGSGAEILFVLLRAPGMDEAAFAADAAAVARDLATLKALLERRGDAPG